MANRTFDAIVVRHAEASYGDLSQEPKRYRGHGLTKKGVESAFTRVEQDFYPMFERMPENGVMVLIGASFRPRTKGTLCVFTEAFKKHQIPNVVDETWLNNRRKQSQNSSAPNAVKCIAENLRTHPKEKFLISFPLSMKEFADPRLYAKKNGKHQIHGHTDQWNWDYLNYLTKKYGGDNSDKIAGWLREEGRAKSKPDRPNPRENFKNYISGIERLERFLKTFIPDVRPIVIVVCGHSGDMDALIDAIANKGRVTGEQYKKLGGIIKETEYARLRFERKTIAMTYRNKQFTIPRRITKSKP